MIFQCNTGRTVGKKIWTGEIRLLTHSSFHYEAVITARDTCFHVIAGKYQHVLGAGEIDHLQTIQNNQFGTK